MSANSSQQPRVIQAGSPEFLEAQRNVERSMINSQKQLIVSLEDMLRFKSAELEQANFELSQCRVKITELEKKVDELEKANSELNQCKVKVAELEKKENTCA